VIVAEWKPIAELVDRLRPHSNIVLAGCATCVAECAAGGEREVETLAPLLRMALQVEGRSVQIQTKTIERQCEREFIEPLAEIVPWTDAVMSMACGIGVQAMAERFPEIPVYPAVNTRMLGIREEAGLWLARCAACGDCILGDTFGLCPVARCAKSLMNGPCGGTRTGGKCEVDETADCVWYLIVERAKARGALDALTAVRPPKSWVRSSHGGPQRIFREDLRP
jgi:hypothetical protein